MPLTKRLLSNQGFLFIALIFVAGFFLIALGEPFLNTLGVCGALWLGLGFAHLSHAIQEERVLARNFPRAFLLIGRSALYGPFANTLFH